MRRIAENNEGGFAVFQEMYDLYGDMCVLDSGKFGFVHLRWFREGHFDNSRCYRDII